MPLTPNSDDMTPTPADIYNAAASADEGAPAQPAESQTSQQPGTLAPRLKSQFEQASLRYNVPVNVLMAIAQSGSGYNPNAQGGAPGPTRSRGIMALPGSQAQGAGISSDDPMAAINFAAQNLRSSMDQGSSIEDAVKQTGNDPTTIIPLAKQIGAQLYPVQPPTQPPAQLGQSLATTPAAPKKSTGSLIADALAYAGGGVDKGEGSIIRGAGELVASLGDVTTTPIINWITGRKGVTPNALGGIADAVESYGSKIQEGASQATQQAAANSQPGQGPLFLGKDPSLRGYVAMGADLLGQVAPLILGTVMTGGSAAAGAIIGGAQGGGQAVEQAHDAIKQMASDGTLAKQSPYYAHLVQGGMAPAAAAQKTADAAGRWAFLLAAPAGMIGGAVSSKIIHPATELAASLNIAGRTAARAGASAADMSAQNVAQTMAANEGQNLGAGTNAPVMQGTGAAAIQGAIMGAVPGAVGGLLPRGTPGAAPGAHHAVQTSNGQAISQARRPDGTLTEPPALASVASPGRTTQPPASGPLSRALGLAAAVPEAAPTVQAAAPNLSAVGSQAGPAVQASASPAWMQKYRRPDPQPAQVFTATKAAQAGAPDQAAMGGQTQQSGQPTAAPAWMRQYARGDEGAPNKSGNTIPPIGSRVVVRHFLPGGSDHSFEIVGSITEANRDFVTLRDDRGEGYHIPRADLESGQSAGGILTIAPHEDDFGEGLSAETKAAMAALEDKARRAKWAENDAILDAQGAGLRDWMDDRRYLDRSTKPILW
jgi:hypothetical protein